MKGNYRRNEGIKVLLKKIKQSFQIPENLNYYSSQDYKKAERNFIKYALQNGDYIASYP